MNIQQPYHGGEPPPTSMNKQNDVIMDSDDAHLKELAALRSLNAEMLAALEAVSRLDYLQEHNALAEKVRNALALAKGGKA